MLLYLLTMVSLLAAASPAAVGISSLPIRPYAEETASGVAINNDIWLTNNGQETLTLVELSAESFDSKGRLLQRKELNENGTAPSIHIITDRTLPANGELMIFNPLTEWPSSARPARLHFELTFEDPEKRRVIATLEVKPRTIVPRALAFPLRGTFLVWDGHDFYSHHRRVNLLLPILKDAGFRSNSGRYSYDLIAVDRTGRRATGDESVNRSWLSFGLPALAVDDGVVVEAVDGQPDDGSFDIKMLSKANAIFGNRIVLKLRAGTYALYGHLQRGSVKVQRGQTVRRGDMIGRIGASGTALFPHLHFQLMDGPTDRSEGVPARFGGATRPNGTYFRNGYIDTGDIVVVQ